MAENPNALDILKVSEKASESWSLGTPSLVVLHGDEPFLVFHVLAALRERLCPDEADRAWAWREFNGDEPLDPRDVFDEVATVPLFSGATRAAVVRSADTFVSATREHLESLASAPRGRRGLVILEVRSFPATTRLAKAAAKGGLVIETSIPARYDLAGWIRQWARSRHALALAPDTAPRLLERLGGNLGQVDQALARLAATAGDAPVPPEAVDAFAGSAEERTAWGMIDAATGGDARGAVVQLADLLTAGENPIAIAAQMAAVLRRLSSAARLLALPAGDGRPGSVEQALRDAGVAAWPKALTQAREALRQLGPRRARLLPVWLLDLDRSLKGDSSRGLRARLAIERLFCKMARSPAPDRGPTGRPPTSQGDIR